LGNIGRRHLSSLRALDPEMEITLVRSGKGASWPELALARRVVKTTREAIDAGAQAAIICSPATLHIEQAMEWVSVAKPLLIEKPLSINTSGLDQLAQLVFSSKARILIGYVLRYDLAAQYFQQQLATDNYGVPLSVRIECGSFLPNWRPEQDYRQSVSASKELGGGVLLELSHELDYANWFFGPFDKVQAVLQNSGTLEIDVEDGAELLLQTATGFTVSIHLDFYSKIPKRHCRVQTTTGELVWDALKQAVCWTGASGQTTEKFLPQERDQLFRRQLLHFLDCVQGVSQPMVPIDQGIQVMQMIDAARESHSSGRMVAL
jgi:predicted dehydrogenase